MLSDNVYKKLLFHLFFILPFREILANLILRSLQLDREYKNLIFC